VTGGLGEDDAAELDEGADLVLEQHFAIVPEWVLFADISDAALRLYAVLLRHGQSSGQRMPSRGVLASRLRKRSKDTVDRALKELVRVGAVVVQRRREGNLNLTNRYIVRSTPPRRRPQPPVASEAEEQARSQLPAAGEGGPAESGRKSAATSATKGGGRNPAATPGRRIAATLAADLRPNPESLTQSKPPPPSPAATALALGGGGRGEQVHAGLLDALGVESLDDVAARCRRVRCRLGLPVARWTPRVLGDVLSDAVLGQGWPAAAAVPALLAVAADPDTRGPARLLVAGPWWDAAEVANGQRARSRTDDVELAGLEAQLAETDGERVRVQRLARQQLVADGLPVTRLNVARRAVALLPTSGSGSRAC
jgi:Helix-turn-helix domain